MTSQSNNIDKSFLLKTLVENNNEIEYIYRCGIAGLKLAFYLKKAGIPSSISLIFLAMNGYDPISYVGLNFHCTSKCYL